MLVAGREFERASPFFGRFGVFLLASVNVGLQLVLFDGGRQLAQASERLHGQLVVSSRAPIVALRSIGRLGGRDKFEELPFAEFALELLSTAIRRRKLAFFLLFGIRPIGMSGLAIDFGHRNV